MKPKSPILKSGVAGLAGVALGLFVGGSVAARPGTPPTMPCARGNGYPDGCAGVGGIGQYPTLLSAYSRRPPWNVAGVDYHVGLPSGYSLADPWNNPTWTTSSSPLKWSSAAKATLRCDAGSNVTISGYDFSLHGGIGFSDVSCTNVTVTLSRFRFGSDCQQPISQSSGATGLAVTFNDLDGGGVYGPSYCSYGTYAETIAFSGGGPRVVKYNYITNVPQHYVTFQGSVVDKNDAYEFNLQDRCGFYQGNHCNGSQWVGGTVANALISYNTLVTDQPDTDLGLAVTGTFIQGSATFTSTNLITISQSNANSLHDGMTITGPNIPSGTKIVGAPTTSGGTCCGPTITTTIVMSKAATSSGVASWDVPNAYPSGMVIPIRYVSQLGGTLTGAAIVNNTIINTPPIIGTSFSVYCDQATNAGYTNVTTGTTIAGNFIDQRGAASPGFYPGRCPQDYVGLPNIDMSTGGTLALP